MHPKDAAVAVPVHPLVSGRWSPYAFAERAIPDADLAAILEAARWAPSSYNEQPWRYLLARRSDAAGFARALSCLVEANQAWARHADVLLLAVAITTFARNGKPNIAAQHDLGLAAGNICVEATARGIAVHQMIGILPDRVRELYALPTEAAPLTALALGYAGDPASLPEPLRERDLAPRSRREVREFVFEGSWGNSTRLAG